MASPNCCGSVALLLSALKAQQLAYSPYRYAPERWHTDWLRGGGGGWGTRQPDTPAGVPSARFGWGVSVKRALENTARPIRDGEPFSHGCGLIQIVRAYDWLAAAAAVGAAATYQDVRYHVTLPLAQNARGIYLRRADETDRVSQIAVKVVPLFRRIDGVQHTHHADGVAMEMPLALKTTQPWISAPSHLLMINNGRQFNVRVDPTALPHGAHYGEIIAFELAAPERCGPSRSAGAPCLGCLWRLTCAW